MGAEPQPSRSPLKLTLLPSQPKSEPPGLLTPPLQPMAAVPFLWEEAPGKPRPFPVAPSPGAASRTKVVRCLDLPPRLLTPEGKGTNTPSPTTVLDGPYYSGGGGRNTLAHTMSFNFGKGSFRIAELGKKKIGKERVNFSSLRWEEESTFKENYDCESGVILGISPSLGVFQESNAPDQPKSTTRSRKRSSFFGSSTSNFWTSIYESVKQAVPWRRKQEKTRRMDY